jgi:hypothetical protein
MIIICLNILERYFNFLIFFNHKKIFELYENILSLKGSFIKLIKDIIYPLEIHEEYIQLKIKVFKLSEENDIQKEDIKKELIINETIKKVFLFLKLIKGIK